MENLLVPFHAEIRIPCHRAIVLAPHPDDEVLGCGGAVMRHVAHGEEVQVIIVTDGAFDAAGEVAVYRRQRQLESRAAADILGYGEPVFWDYSDRRLCYGEKLIEEIITAIRTFEADLIYAPSVFEMHPDHRVLGMAAMEAVRRTGGSLRLAAYEVGVPLAPNLLLDISDLAERKQAAMQCFGSQNEKQRYDLHIAALNRYRTYTLPASVTAAEAYILVTAEALLQDPFKLYQSEYTRQRALGLPLENRDVPLVSVIIRSMDRPTLSDALDSVALQTYPNVEVVVVNAKGPGHRAVGDWCGRFPLRMTTNDEPLHRSKAANVGLDSAQGRYLIFLDDDDLFDPDHIANLIEILSSVRHCSIAYAGVRVVDQAGITCGVYNQTYVAAKLIAGNFIPIHAALFERELVIQGCRFDEKLDSYEDWDFWLQIAQHTEFAHTEKISASYRAALGESGMSLPLASHLQLQRQSRLAIWKKWWRRWTTEDFDCLVTDFREQLASLQEKLSATAIDHDNKIHTLQNEYETKIATLNTDYNQIIAESNNQIAQLNQHYNQTIAECNNQIAQLNHQNDQLKFTITEIFNSRSWKLTIPVRYLSLAMRKNLGYMKPAFHLALHYYRRESGYKLFKNVIGILRNEGVSGIKWRLNARQHHHKPVTSGLKAKSPAALKPQHNHLPLCTIDIEKYDFFFFDVFDTAIIRLFQKPTDLFEYISFRKKDSRFYDRRIQQEAKTRQQYGERKEISIFEIYDNLTGDLIDAEIAAELTFCVANPKIFHFYSKLLGMGKKIYFISDMYLDKKTISTILEKNGFRTYEDVYVSSEDDLLKGDGSRFEWLKRNIPGNVGLGIHIGDNYTADFLQPQAHGFDAFHVIESDAYFRQDSFLYSKIEFLDTKRTLGLSFLISTFRYWKLGFSDQLPGYWRQFGFFYGGALISAFCGFINAQLLKKKLSCDKIFFLARDGDIMSKVYRLLYDNFEAVYLMASRRCMSFPSIKSFTHTDDEDVLRLFTTPIGITGAQDILDRFCYSDLHHLETDLNHLYPNDPSAWTDQDIRACLLRNKQSIMEKVLAERGLILDYLATAGFFDQEDTVIIDVGWNGTIQNSLARLLELGGYKNNRLHGIYLGVNDHATDRQHKTGFLFDGDQSQFSDYLNLIELITSSPQNGIIRIERINGDFLPVTGTISEHEKKRQLISEEIQKGILDFAHLIKKQNIINLDFIRPDDFKTLFASLQAHASEEDAAQFQQLKHAQMIGNSYTQYVLTNS